ncbi:MAG: hypothetical protein HQL84_10210 [Magnetococcales bacterium]|nr:hypothetical protein [Magnetococcales bacterium]MBF0150405.1 hypothetical protein [Magnetococcales bacterium]
MTQPDANASENGWKWFLFWFIWSLILSGLFWVLGPGSYLRIRDAADSDLTLQIIAARDFLRHGATFWNPHVGGGLPAWGSHQVDSLLLTFPFFFLPPWAALGLILQLQRFVAGYFSYRLFRSMNVGPRASLIAGLLYSFNNWGVEDWRLTDALGLPATPMYLYLFDRLLKLPSKRVALAGAFVLGIGVGLGGSAAYYTSFFLLFLPLWFVIVSRVPLKSLWPFYGLFAAGAVLVETPEVLALFSFALRSSRTLVQPNADPGSVELWAGTWNYFHTALPTPMLVLLLVSLLGILVRGKGRGLFLRSIFLFLFILSYQPLLQWSLFLSGMKMPFTGLSIYDFKNSLFFTTVAVVTIGLHRVLEGIQTFSFPKAAWNSRVEGVILAVYVFMILYAGQALIVNLARRSHSDNYHAIFEHPALKTLAEKTRNDPPFRVATIVAHGSTTSSASGHNFYPNYPLVYGFETIDGFYRMYPMRLYHYWRRVIARILSERPELDNTIKFYQYLFTLNSHGFDRFRAMIPVASSDPIPFDQWYRLNLLSLSNTRFIFSHWPLTHPELQLVHDPVEERKIRQKWEQYRKREMILGVLNGEPPPHALYIYENRSVLPRVFLVGQVRVASNQAEVLDALERSSVSELSKFAWVEPGAIENPSRFAAPLNGYKTSLFYPRPDRVRIRCRADAPSILVLTDNYDELWRVRVDGEEQKLFPVDYLYRGVALGPGTHDIVMEYQNVLSLSRLIGPNRD